MASYVPSYTFNGAFINVHVTHDMCTNGYLYHHRFMYLNCVMTTSPMFLLLFNADDDAASMIFRIVFHFASVLNGFGPRESTYTEMSHVNRD